METTTGAGAFSVQNGVRQKRRHFPWCWQQQQQHPSPPSSSVIPSSGPFLLLLLFQLLAIVSTEFAPTLYSENGPNAKGPLWNSSMGQAEDHRRLKRQWGGYQQQQQQLCPPQCFACSPMHCQAYQCVQPQVVNMVRCCCRPALLVHPQPDLKTACDGEEAVAACLNGLCGQGFFCNSRKFCCRCPTGKSIGNCVNGLCPTGYACNSNNYCCAMGSGSVMGPCVNGKCPDGYECGAGDLCYARSGNSWAQGGRSTPRTTVRRNYPIRRGKPRWMPPSGRMIKKGRKGRVGPSWRQYRGEDDGWPSWRQDEGEEEAGMGWD